MEIIHDGWLKKSPPEKRIWRAKWRRRWFVLRQSGQIPGQYFLEYFTDQTCKKRKGIIDLDQCEQVDCGVSVEESWHHKNTFEHVFDIRTPKRLYYLVADQETEMNTWVEYICSVCGLKMHVEGNELDQPASELSNQVVLNEPSPFQEIANLLEVNATRDSASVKEDTQSLASVSTCGPSGPYIPISECISGPSPLISERLRDVRIYCDDQDDVFPDQVPPPPPKGNDNFQPIQADFYDYPRQMHPPSMDDMLLSSDVTHPSWQQYSLAADEVADLSTMPPPPRVNWDTYPRGMDSENIYANNRRASDSQDVLALNSSVIGKFKRLSLTEGNVEDACASQTNLISSTKQCSSSSSSSVSSTCRAPSQKPPPRPPRPKPRHLIQTLHLNSQNGNVSGNPYANSNNYDNIANCEISSLYDVPPSAQGVFLSKSLPAKAFAYLKDNEIENISDFSPPCGKGQYLADEMYDFPRNTHDGPLEATPPAPTGESIWQRRHAYSNAPTLLIGDGDSNNNGEEYLIMDPHQRRLGNDIYTDMSGEGRSPTSLYSNVPSPLHRNECTFTMDAAPAVDRGLKPGRKAESISPKTQVNPQPERTLNNIVTSTAITTIQRCNAPVVNRELKPKRTPDGVETIPTLLQSGNAVSSSTALLPAYINLNKNKRSFRKPRLVPGRATASFSRLTSSNGMLHPNNRTKDRSSSDDDQSSSCTSSRRNSSNDDHVANKQTSHVKSPSPGAINSSKASKQSGASGSSQSTEPELHYLDLDLENDAKAQSPKSPSPKSPEKLTSTVYNTVDFVRTKAFNDTRQHVEATYRKS